MFGKKEKNKDQGYWKVTLFHPDTNHKFDYDPGHVEFTHDYFPYPIKKTNTWLKGEGVYDTEGYKPPKLFYIWHMLCGKFKCNHFYFENWVISREYESFRYQLMVHDGKEVKPIYENIYGDDLARKVHFIDFLYMMRETELNILDENENKLIGFEKFEKERLRKMSEMFDGVLDGSS